MPARKQPSRSAKRQIGGNTRGLSRTPSKNKRAQARSGARKMGGYMRGLSTKPSRKR